MLLCGNGKQDFKIFNDLPNDNNAKQEQLHQRLSQISWINYTVG